MADVLATIFGKMQKRYRDMGDGSHAEVVTARMIQTAVVSVPTVGGAGVAAGSVASTALVGALVDVKIDLDPAAPATTDVTIRDAFNGNMLVVSNMAADGEYRPLGQACDAAGAAIPGTFVPWALNGPVTVDVAQCDPLAAGAVVTIRYISP